MRTINVELGDRSYPIYIGKDLLGNPALWRKHVRAKQVLLVTNPTVAALYGDAIRCALAGFQIEEHCIADGEEFKTFGQLEKIFDTLVSNRFSRDCTIIALGGGVVGDMAGFAAACYQRGVSFIQVPTTLLAQVDSSVGGKTAVNHPQAKNMIGAFHQPVAVLADTSTLKSLPERELCAGLAEVVKYGLIRDPDFFNWIETNTNALLGREDDALAYAIMRSCDNKREVVQADERESGERALLNLGHTFGHAIESALGYGEWLHGEAVAAGCVLAAELSCRAGQISGSDVQRIERIFEQLKLPIRLPHKLDAATLASLMRLDKKVVGGSIRLILLDAIGKARITADFDARLLESVLIDATAK